MYRMEKQHCICICKNIYIFSWCRQCHVDGFWHNISLRPIENMSKPIILSKITVFKTLIRARNWQQHSISNMFKIIKYHDDMDIACCKELQGNVLFHQFEAQHILGLANLVMRVYQSYTKLNSYIAWL